MKLIMNTETALNKCDLGEAIGDECHKLSHTRILIVLGAIWQIYVQSWCTKYNDKKNVSNKWGRLHKSNECAPVLCNQYQGPLGQNATIIMFCSRKNSTLGTHL